jgi:hypothetical protein
MCGKGQVELRRVSIRQQNGPLMKRILWLATIVFTCIQVEGQRVSPFAKEAAQTIRELRAIGLPDFENGQTVPPARVPGLLRQLNRQLRGLITDTLTVPSRHGIASEKEIFAQLRAAGWEEIPSNKWNAYGEINRIVFSGSAEEPGVLVVSTQLWLPCNSADPDTAIYVFHGSVRDWKLVLSTDADFMPSGDNGVGMQYRISPPDAKGGWYLAIAQTPPACGPVPADLRYKILRPGPSAEEPRILMNHREPLNTKFSPPFRLETEDDWFAVTRGKQRKLDGEPGVSITRYQITGDQIVRIQPLALTPDDFLDEWVQLDWSEASRWSGSQTDLSTWHSKLQALDSDSTEFEFVQPCPQGTES